MQPIVEEVKATIPPKAYDCKLSHAAAAVHMTMIKSVRLGACMTLSDERVFNFNQIQPVSHLGEIENLTLSEIIKWTESSQGIERSFGFAASWHRCCLCFGAAACIGRAGRRSCAPCAGGLPC